MTRKNVAVIVAVSYADIFDFPLTVREVNLWSQITIQKVPDIRGLEYRGGYIFLKGRKSIIALRKRREHIAKAKWKRAKLAANIFRIIPSIVLVGVTGGLAMDNTKPGDDIDMFFITRKGTLWISRMMATILSDMFAIRRKPGEVEVSDKICLNMFMSEDALRLPSSEQDLFAAHEVLQMVPLWERGGAYAKFLRANTWVKRFLPNAWKAKNHERKKKSVLLSFIIQYSVFMIQLLEPMARFLQLWYMKARRTSEVIRAGEIRFHPKDARVWVREKLATRLKKWDIPLDKIFYQP